MGGKVAKFAPLALSRSRGHAILAPVSGSGGKLNGAPSVWKSVLRAAGAGCGDSFPSHGTAAAGTRRLKGFVEAAKQAGITDEYAGRPLYRKLRQWKEQPPFWPFWPAGCIWLSGARPTGVRLPCFWPYVPFRRQLRTGSSEPGGSRFFIRACWCSARFLW